MEGGLCVHNGGVQYTVRYPGGVSGSFLSLFFPSVVRRVNGWSVLRSPVNLFLLEELQAPMKIETSSLTADPFFIYCVHIPTRYSFQAYRYDATVTDKIRASFTCPLRDDYLRERLGISSASSVHPQPKIDGENEGVLKLGRRKKTPFPFLSCQ